MKVLIVSPFYPSLMDKQVYGFVHARVKTYIKAGYRPKVFIPSPHDPFMYSYEDVDVIRAPLNYVANVVEKFDPDVVAVHAPRFRWVSCLSKLERPIISWIHGADTLVAAFHNYYFPLSFKDNIDKLRSLLVDPVKRISIRQILRMSTAVVYVSKWMRKTGERYLLFKHPMSFVIPNPVDVDLFRPINSNVSPRLKRGISVRGLRWKYGLDIAIKAFSNLRKSDLTIVGSGLMEEYLRKLAETCRSNVTFITSGIEHEKLPALYGKFGYFVAPSRTEAQGVAMCEAMACGLPAITTKVGGIPEFVVDGFNGILIPPEEPLKLRNAIKLLISNSELHKRLSENAIHFVKNNLSNKVILQKESAIFKQAQEVYGK